MKIRQNKAAMYGIQKIRLHYTTLEVYYIWFAYDYYIYLFIVRYVFFYQNYVIIHLSLSLVC